MFGAQKRRESHGSDREFVGSRCEFQTKKFFLDTQPHFEMMPVFEAIA